MIPRRSLCLPLLILPALPLAAQENHPDPLKEEPAPPPNVQPFSDKEETGSLSDMLPGYVEPLTLPEPAGPEPATLFPSEIWSPPPPPDSALTWTDPLTPAVGHDSHFTPDSLASAFPEQRPPALHDPQNLLPTPAAAPLRQLLEKSLNHRSGIHLTLLVLGGAQQIPVSLDLQPVLDRWFPDTKGALIIYHAGHPERTLAWFSAATHAQHRSEDLRLLVDLGMKEAARHSSPMAQLQRFCVKTALRLDRLHRQGEISPSDEFASPTAATVTESVRNPFRWLLTILLPAALLAAVGRWWQLRHRRLQPIHLPPQEITPRLGGAHSGGFGAQLHFNPPHL